LATLAKIILSPPLREEYSTAYALEKISTVRDYFKLVLDCDGQPKRLADRQPRPWDPPDKTPYNFSLKQYNMLAEGLSSSERERRHLGQPKTLNQFGGLNAVKYPDITLGFENRKWLLLEELLDGHPDVVTVQECDHYHSFFQPIMSRHGYDSCFVPKVDSPCLQFGFFSDGVAIFWQRDQFATVDDGHESGQYYNASGGLDGQVYLVQTLYHKLSGRKLVVGTTHLKAKSSPENEMRRTFQAGEFSRAMLEMAHRQGGCPAVFGADLNADACAVGPVAPMCVPRLAKHFESAYPLPEDADDPMFTTWKKRGTSESRHVIDYIWHTTGEGLVVDALQGGVPPETMQPERMPSMVHPSDHLSIMASFSFDRKVMSPCN